MATATKAKKKIAIPLGDNVLIELLITDETEGGIILPGKDANTGIVRAIGGGVEENFIADKDGCRSRGLLIGDKVYLPKGQNVGELVKSDNGEKVFLVVPPRYISFIIEEK